MNIKFLILSLTIVFTSVNAQQFIQFTQVSQYNLYRNVAYTGFNSEIDAAIAHRSLYVGLGTSAIHTQYAGFSMPIATPKFGLGFRLFNDKIGLQRYTQLELTTAYHPLIANHKLSIGASVGFIQLGLKGNEITTPSGEYAPGIVIHNDDYLPTVSSGGAAPTVSLGVLYAYKNLEFEIGAQNIFSPKIKISNVQSGTKIFIGRTINLSALYVINLSAVKLTPMIYTKTDFKKWQLQAQLTVDWRKILFGAGFRGYNGLNNDAVFGIFGFKLKENYKIAYSYDYNVSYLNNSNFGSHEISLKMNLKKGFNQKIKEKVLYNPRFL